MRASMAECAILTVAITLLTASIPAAQDALPDEFDPLPRPYLLYKVTLGLTLESPFPLGNENRSTYNLGGGAGINFEMHLLYPLSFGFNARLSRVFLKDPEINALNLRTVGLTMRMYLDPRNDRQPFLLLSLGAGSARPSSSPNFNSTSSGFLTAELGAGYMMRMSSHSWLRFELAYTSNSQFGVTTFDFGGPGTPMTTRAVDYKLSGIMFRVEAGIVSW